MFACRWTLIFLLVLCLARTDCTEPESQVHSQKSINQSDAELALNIQTSLRRYLLKSLSKIREKITRFEDFSAAVVTLIQGLQTREVNPLQLFKKGNFIHKNQSIIFRLAELIYNLQNENHEETALPEWNLLLQSIPDLSAAIPPLPNAELTSEDLQKIEKIRKLHVFRVLAGVQKNYLKPNKKLLADLLYNYRFRDHSAELDVTLDNYIQILEKNQIDFVNFWTDPAAKRPNEVLSDILQYTLKKLHFDSELVYPTTRLISALANTVDSQKVSELYKLFDLMKSDDYPQDVIAAKNDLGLAVKTNQVGLDLGEVAESLEGYSPSEKLLGLIAKLTLIPSGNPLFLKVHAIYPHVKLKFLSIREKFFRPQTPSDVAFLLNSFLTIPNQINLFLINEIQKIFLLSNFNWKEVLKNFEYSLYEKPRPLIRDMLEKLLKDSVDLPASVLIMFNYFLRTTKHISSCSAVEVNDIIINAKQRIPKTTVSLLPADEERNLPPPSKNVTPTATTHSITVKQCPDGPSIELVDPESIIEIVSSSHRTDFIIDTIRYNPMPVEKYSSRARVDIYKKALEELKNDSYNDDMSVFDIEQALSRTPLNEKANLSPKYIHLCPSEVTKMKVEASLRSQKMKNFKFTTVTNTLNATTTTSSPVGKQFQACSPNPLIEKTSSTKKINNLTFSPITKQPSFPSSLEPSIVPLPFLTTPSPSSRGELSTSRTSTGPPLISPVTSLKSPSSPPPSSLPRPTLSVVSSPFLAPSTTSKSSPSKMLSMPPLQPSIAHDPVISHSPASITSSSSTPFPTGETSPSPLPPSSTEKPSS